MLAGLAGQIVKRTPTLGLVPRVGVCLFLLLFAGCASPVDELPSPTPPIQASPTATEIQLPDLAITDVSIRYQRPIDTPCSLDPHALQAEVVVQNKGSAAADPFSVQVNNQTQMVPGLESGAVTRLMFLTSSPNLITILDSRSQVAERDEGNNRLARFLEMPPQPTECRPTPTPVIAMVQALMTLKGHSGAVYDLEFSPDGALLASGSADNSLRLWQVQDGKELRVMQGHNFPVTRLVFTPTGSGLITGSTDGLIRLWQVRDGILLRTLRSPAGWVTGLDISPDGKLLAASAEDYSVRVWRLSNYQPVQTIDEGMSLVNRVVFSPDSRWLAWGESDGTVRIHSALEAQWQYIFQETHQAARCVRFAPDGSWLAAGFADGAIRVWSLNDGRLMQTLRSHTGAIHAMAVAPDGAWLATASADGTLRLWNWAAEGFESTPSTIFTGHSSPILTIAISPAGDLLASGSQNGEIRIWRK